MGVALAEGARGGPTVFDHAPLVAGLLERYGTIAWCEPDTEMEQQGPAAVRWLEEQADALRVGPGGAEPEPLALRVVRSQRELLRRFRSGLEGTREGGSVRRFREAVKRLELGAHPYPLEVQRAVAKLVSERRSEPSWVRSLGSVTAPRTDGGAELVVRGCSAEPGVAPLQMHAVWLAKFGPAEPSPWEPIVALFERGAWPVFADGELVVWVPLRRDGVIEDPSPVKPVPPMGRGSYATVEQWLDAPDAAARAIGLGLERGRLISYLEAGLATPPCTFTLSAARDLWGAGAMPCLSPAVCLSVAPPRVPVKLAGAKPVETRKGVVDRFKRWLAGDERDDE